MIRMAAITYVLFLIFDAVWLGFVARNMYIEELKPIGRIVDGKFQIVYWAAAIVYLLLSIGLAYFVWPSLNEGSTMVTVFLSGALFGLVVYGVYDMTNLATLKDFSLKIALADMAWGTFLCGAVMALADWINNRFFA